jgi:hypothetical protein
MPSVYGNTLSAECPEPDCSQLQTMGTYIGQMTNILGNLERNKKLEIASIALDRMTEDINSKIIDVELDRKIVDITPKITDNALRRAITAINSQVAVIALTADKTSAK